ncbi:MAG: hypothetical protein LBH25_11110 [Fibromonadaceae bacterium]|jgi:predicted  nucleic acid-binding Zn-ribbon protein|nr:hypothetical protein [Fibromonadaceae bacterium]
MDNTIDNIVAYNDSLNYIRDKLKAKIDEKSDINEKIEFLEKEISEYEHGYSKRIPNESFEKADVRMIEAIIHDLRKYREELLCELKNIDLGRPIESPLNPKFGKSFVH